MSQSDLFAADLIEKRRLELARDFDACKREVERWRREYRQAKTHGRREFCKLLGEHVKQQCAKISDEMGRLDGSRTSGDVADPGE